MIHEDCIFCKIINGDIPSAKVYEDNDVYAFLDISQVTKGHTLVIPKTHVKDIYQTPEEVASNLFAQIPKISKGIKEAFQPEGINILSNTGEVAGQSVFHLHIHLIPRYGKEDGFKPTWETHSEDYTQEVLQSIAKNIHEKIHN
ncbi:HIT-like protein [Paraliobacillus sp. PM-2]|uniref:HIT family protein n=1 Tax=Paraliobacillus sp. PM-2 TaxID=1462524 RepID=UPI00061CBD4F|nr:HIT family protein [Paraliobacillus sp. PM-2]CQR47037.1 HIT-like protein [Paraliobacillus sp. PM-2]